jgi:hypothetical protein
MMTDKPADPRNEQELARRTRLAKALRDNLKRRKSQSRGRTEPPDAPQAGLAPADRPGPAAADEKNS